jgi:hypothetical protein
MEFTFYSDCQFSDLLLCSRRPCGCGHQSMAGDLVLQQEEYSTQPLEENKSINRKKYRFKS